MSTAPPILVSAAILYREDRVLLTRRVKGAHLEGYWEFPGGKVEPGEDPKDALVREVREECAIDIEVVDILDVTFHRYASKDVLLLFYECRLRDGGAHEVAHVGVADHAWCLPAEIGDYPLPPPDDAVVAKIRARARLTAPPGGA